MSRHDNEKAVLEQYNNSRLFHSLLVGKFVTDVDAVLDQAAENFSGMLPDMAYVDKPDDPMANNLFLCCGILALYQALEPRNVSVEDFGSAMLDFIRQAPQQDATDQTTAESPDITLREAARRSQTEPLAGEFVFELLEAEAQLDWGMNIKSCAICHAFAKYDAMDLVPYMCASDDVVSDRAGSGLRRTGSIAVGAHECDFRYKQGAEPLYLADQYPQKIKLKQQD